MKRLSELPKRNEEIHPLDGENAVKLLAAHPDGDFLVEAKEMFKETDESTVTASAVWNKESQIKDTFTESASAPTVLSNAEAIVWLKSTQPHYDLDDTLFIDLPNTDIGVASSEETNAVILKDALKTTNYIRVDNAGPESESTFHVFPGKQGSQDKRVKVFFECATTSLRDIRFASMSPIHDYNDLTINLPNITELTGKAFSFTAANIIKNANITVLLPNVTSIEQDTTSARWGLGTSKGGFPADNGATTISLYLPSLDSSFSFYANGEKLTKESIIYLLSYVKPNPSSPQILTIGVNSAWGTEMEGVWAPAAGSDLANAVAALGANWSISWVTYN